MQPDSEGAYWARSSSRIEWFDLIVLVEGNPPFLRPEGVFSFRGRAFDRSLVQWGPKIERPEMSQEQEDRA